MMDLRNICGRCSKEDDLADPIEERGVKKKRCSKD
jgi:hypothetical protein